MAERGNACIRFKDLERNVRLNANSLRSRADLERTLSNYNLSLEPFQLYVSAFLST